MSRQESQCPNGLGITVIFSSLALLLHSTAVQALPTWSWDFDNPVQEVTFAETVNILATITVDSASEENFILDPVDTDPFIRRRLSSGIALGQELFTRYNFVGFGGNGMEPCLALSICAETGINLAPGESFSFVFASFVPRPGVFIEQGTYQSGNGGQLRVGNTEMPFQFSNSRQKIQITVTSSGTRYGSAKGTLASFQIQVKIVFPIPQSYSPKL